MSLLFHVDAENALNQLQNDATQKHLYNKINDALDLIEDHPTTSKARQRRYHQTKLWGIPVYGNKQDWLIIWEPADNNQIIHYIGPEI